MACDKTHLYEYLSDFTGTRPLEAVYCAFSSDAGAGMGFTTFSLFFFGAMGLGLTIRTQHPGPILVAGILSAGVVAARVPSQGAKIMALVVFFGIVAIALLMYRSAKRGGL